MKRLKYNNNKMIHLYLTNEDLETILNSFDFYLNIFRNLRHNYLLTDKEYLEVKSRVDKIAQNLYNIYINNIDKK